MISALFLDSRVKSRFLLSLQIGASGFPDTVLPRNELQLPDSFSAVGSLGHPPASPRMCYCVGP